MLQGGFTGPSLAKAQQLPPIQNPSFNVAASDLKQRLTRTTTAAAVATTRVHSLKQQQVKTEHEDTYRQQFSLRMLVPEERSSKVIGTRGSTISHIAKSTSCRLNVAHEAFS